MTIGRVTSLHRAQGRSKFDGREMGPPLKPQMRPTFETANEAVRRWDCMARCKQRRCCPSVRKVRAEAFPFCIAVPNATPMGTAESVIAKWAPTELLMLSSSSITALDSGSSPASGSKSLLCAISPLDTLVRNEQPCARGTLERRSALLFPLGFERAVSRITAQGRDRQISVLGKVDDLLSPPPNFSFGSGPSWFRELGARIFHAVVDPQGQRVPHALFGTRNASDTRWSPLFNPVSTSIGRTGS